MILHFSSGGLRYAPTTGYFLAALRAGFASAVGFVLLELIQVAAHAPV